jgi:hypothetical protein
MVQIIDCLAGTNRAVNSLAGGQPEVQPVTAVVDGFKVVLIDTPGFDPGASPSVTVLQIQDWLNKYVGSQSPLNRNMTTKPSHKKKACLIGILYLHRISDNRMTKLSPSVLRTLLEPKKGEGKVELILVTTMWDTISPEKAKTREKELHENYWKEMLDLGARTDRFDKKETSARRIIRRILQALEEDIRQQQHFLEDVEMRIERYRTSSGLSSLVEMVFTVGEMIEVSIKTTFSRERSFLSYHSLGGKPGRCGPFIPIRRHLHNSVQLC